MEGGTLSLVRFWRCPLAGGRKVPSVAWLLKRLAACDLFRDLAHRVGGSPLSVVSQSVTLTLTLTLTLSGRNLPCVSASMR